MDEILTTKGVADYAKVSVSHLKKLRRSGAGPKHTGPPRRIRYRKSAVDAWVASNKK